MEHEARRRAEALDRYWDELIADPAMERSVDVDEVHAATVRRVDALHNVPGLAAARQRIWRHVAQTSGHESANVEIRADTIPVAVVPPSWSPNGRTAPHPDGPPPAEPMARHLPLWRTGRWAVAAMVVLVAIAGLVVVAQRRPQPGAAVAVRAPDIVARFELVWQTSGGSEPIVQPQGLTIDPRGELWVVDGGNDRFQIFDREGTLLEAWGAPGAARGQFDFFSARAGAPRGDIAFDAAGDFYVADAGNHRIQKFAADRSFLLAWGSEGTGDGQFLTAKSIAIGPDGTVYVCDEERGDVQKFDAEGRFLGIIDTKEPGARKPFIASGVAVDREGFVWVADRSNDRIARFSPDGVLRNAWGVSGTRPGELFHPYDLAIDKAGLIYVVDSRVGRIQLFAPDGRYLTELRGNPGSPEWLPGPGSIAVDQDQTVYVSGSYSLHAFRLQLLSGLSLTP